MSSAITISGPTYTVVGTIKSKENNEGVDDLHVLVYDKDILKEDFLGIAVTDAQGMFSLSFDTSKFNSFFDRSPDLYFIVQDSGFELLDTKDQVIKDANASTPAINLVVDLSDDKLRQLIKPDAAEGWDGTFAQSNPAFGYTEDKNPDLSSLDMQENMKNIGLLQRQQKVVWPEFSWETEPDMEETKRCYQMFAPDISRLGYDNDGQVFSVICPQQGVSSPYLGSINIEVTVTGNRGWADETNRELAADMKVVGKIWFAPSANEYEYVNLLAEHFKKNDLPFPSDKDHAIIIKTNLPGGNPEQTIFPLTKGLSTDFPIPDFAKHEGISWTKGHLGVQIGAIEPTEFEVVNEFNQLILDIFNTASGNMLQNGNVLTWNVWFTAPEEVIEDEWQDHADKWRKSIDVDNESPEGPGSIPRYFDGTPFEPMKDLLIEELPRIKAFVDKHLKG
jgi:hypothetical protein